MRRIESWSGDDGVEKEGRARNPDIFLPIAVSDRLAEVVFFRLRVSRENSVFAIFGADIVEEQISVGGFVVGPSAEADPSSVARAVVGGDEIGTGVAFDLLVPDVNSRSVPIQLIAKDDVIFDRLLDKDPVTAVGVADIKEGGAVDGMGIQIDPVHEVATADIGDGMNAVCAVTPDSATVVSVYIAAIEKDGIAAFAVLRVDSVSGPCNQAGAFDQGDASGVGVNGEVGLAICVQFSARDRAETCFRKKDNLSERFGPCPCGLEEDTQVRQDAGIRRHEETAIGRKFQAIGVFADVFSIKSNDEDVVGVFRLGFSNFCLYEGEINGEDFRRLVLVRGFGFFFSSCDQGEIEATHSSDDDRVGVGSVEGGGIKKL